MKSSIIKIGSLITLLFFVVLYFLLRPPSENPLPPFNLQAEFIDTDGNARITWDAPPKADSFQIIIKDFVSDSTILKRVVSAQPGANEFKDKLDYKPLKVEVSTILDGLLSSPAKKNLDIIIIEDVVVMREVQGGSPGMEDCKCDSFDVNPRGWNYQNGDLFDMSSNMSTGVKKVYFFQISNQANTIVEFKVGLFDQSCVVWEVKRCGNGPSQLEFCDSTGNPTTNLNPQRIKVINGADWLDLKSVQTVTGVGLAATSSNSNFVVKYSECEIIEPANCPD